MIGVIFFAFKFKNNTDSYQDRKNIGIIVIVIFLILFGGLGSCV
jgi:hypothetical protein